MNFKSSSSLKSSISKIIFVFLLLSNFVINVWPKTIGPDIVARARLLRDLPLTRTLKAQSKVNQRDHGHVTNIYVSISARSVDLDFNTGIFSMNGWVSLRYVQQVRIKELYISVLACIINVYRLQTNKKFHCIRFLF